MLAGHTREGLYTLTPPGARVQRFARWKEHNVRRAWASPLDARLKNTGNNLRLPPGVVHTVCGRITQRRSGGDPIKRRGEGLYLRGRLVRRTQRCSVEYQ